MLRQIEERIAFEESESLSHLFDNLERIDIKEKRDYERTLPRYFTVRQAAFFLDVPESALLKKKDTRELKFVRPKSRNTVLIPRREVIRILKDIDLLTLLSQS